MRRLITVVLTTLLIEAALPSQADGMVVQGIRIPSTLKARMASRPKPPPPPRPTKNAGNKRNKVARSMTTLPKVDLPPGTVPGGENGGSVGRGRRRAVVDTSDPSSVNISSPRPAPRTSYNANSKPSFAVPSTNTGISTRAAKGGTKHHGKRRG